MNDIKNQASHFRFGENWKHYSSLIDDERLRAAEDGLLKLLPCEMLEGATFLDIGCGSGIHAVVALKNGVKSVYAIDIDPDSVQTTQSLIEKLQLADLCKAECLSVFDLDEKKHGQFDIVYSWGVLHHTGAMHEALERAANVVKPGGLIVIAVYRKTRFCRFWKWEKRIYSHSSRWLQAMMRVPYKAALFARLMLKRQNPIQYVRQYKNNRGMSFHHDVHDWMGGYPYESVSTEEVRDCFKKLGFDPVKEYTFPQTWGLFGSGCDEYVFRKR
jgi:2-polyprenyl-6-hydroxyphenyl methylase/3-demethylubiquinone-9 3-methyltransferase